LKTTFKDGSVVGSTNLFVSDAELKMVSDNLKTAQVRTTRISRQKWTKTKLDRFTGSRAARRSVPFPNGGGERVAVPQRWITTKDVIVDVTEFLVSVRVGGRAQLDFNLGLPTTKAEKLMAMTCNQIISCILTKRSLAGNPRGALLTALKFFPVMDDAPKNRRKQTAPWCIPTKVCEHNFGRIINGRLLSCSLCASKG
jgi:hypothetical protein